MQSAFEWYTRASEGTAISEANGPGSVSMVDKEATDARERLRPRIEQIQASRDELQIAGRIAEAKSGDAMAMFEVIFIATTERVLVDTVGVLLQVGYTKR